MRIPACSLVVSSSHLPGAECKIVTEFESQVLSAKEEHSDFSPEDISRLIKPDFDQLSADRQAAIVQRVGDALELWNTHGDGQWKDKLLIKD